MPVLDFLFGGSPPPSVTTFGTQQNNIPQWLSDYSQAIAARATEAAGMPLQQPNFARVAGFTPDQQASFAATRALPGQVNPILDQGRTALDRAMRSPGATAAAQPYMARAGASAADQVQNYISPYNKAVTDEIARLGARNLHENLLPGINDTFIKSGMFGGDRNKDFVARAVRDANESIIGAQSGALERGYGTALSAAGADTDRAARAAQLAATTADTDAGRALSTAAGAGNLASTVQQSGLRGAAGLGAVGAEQQALDQRSTDVALQDFLEARGYPRDQVNFLTNAIRGVPYSTSADISRTGPADRYQPSLFSNLAGGALTLSALGGAFPGAASGVSDFIGSIPSFFGFAKGGRVQKPMPKRQNVKMGGALRAI